MDLKVLSWNAQSIKNKIKSELADHLLKNFYHLILIQETWLSDKSEVSLPGYSCLRADRKTNLNLNYPHGGVLIFIHKSILGQSVKFCHLEHVESLFIKLTIGSFSFVLGTTYISPKKSRLEFFKDFNKILSQPGPFIIAGDFNAKHKNWNNPSNCRKGTDLNNLCKRHNCSINFPDVPTLHPQGKGDKSIVDFVVSKGVLGISKPELAIFGSSDHLPIAFQLPCYISLPPEVKIKDYAKTDWNIFQESFSSQFETEIDDDIPLNSRAEIDSQINSLSRILLTAARTAIPLKTPSTFRYPTSQEIEDLKKSRNTLRRSLHNEPALKQELNRLNKKIRRLTASLSYENFSNKLATLSVQDLSLFEMAKNLKKKHKPIAPLLNSDGDFVWSDKQKSNLIAEAFRKAHEIPQTPTKHSLDVAQSITEIDVALTNFNNIDRIRVNEVKDLISSLQLKKACGFDEITNRLIKNMPPEGAPLLAKIFTACLESSYFPEIWKKGKIVAIAKPGKDSRLPESFRPITLLPVIGKLFEKTILSRLQECERASPVLIPQQFGFRPKHSTTQQICRITKVISSRLDEKKSTAMALIDIERAFDSTWHEALLHKLKSYNLPMYLIKITAAFLRGRESFVSINGSESFKFQIPAGVPQGSPLSPTLFNYFINDVPVPKNCKIAVYADDTAILTSGKNKKLEPLVKRLNRGLNLIDSHFTEWKIKLNHAKTEVMLFTRSPITASQKAQHKVTFKGTNLDWKNSVRYLGFYLDPKIKFGVHIDTQLAKARKALSVLYCLLKKHNRVKTKAKVTIYRSYIRPIFTYACPVYSSCAKTHFRKMQIFQNKCLRMALSAPYRTRIEALPPIGSTKVAPCHPIN